MDAAVLALDLGEVIAAHLHDLGRGFARGIAGVGGDEGKQTRTSIGAFELRE
jgi:hypothetical protein